MGLSPLSDQAQKTATHISLDFIEELVILVTGDVFVDHKTTGKVMNEMVSTLTNVVRDKIGAREIKNLPMIKSKVVVVQPSLHDGVIPMPEEEIKVDPVSI